MNCAFCGKKKATHYTSAGDFVCRACAINFELVLQFSDDYELYEQGQASPKLVADIEAAKTEWEGHFAEPVPAYSIPDELEALDKAWTELKIEVVQGAYTIEILATAYDGIRYFWKLKGSEDYLGFDRLFETQGQALDDALEFLKDLQEAE
jgi:hypothetical protein